MPTRQLTSERISLLLVSLLLLSVRGTLVAQDGSAAERALTQAYAKFSDAYRNADADAVARLYTEDAFYLQPGSDILRGRAAIRQAFEGFLGPIKQRGGPGPSIYFEILERTISGDKGWDVGYFRMGPPGADSAASARGGKFIVLWRKDPDGQWRLHADGYSGLGDTRRN